MATNKKKSPIHLFNGWLKKEFEEAAKEAMKFKAYMNDIPVKKNK